MDNQVSDIELTLLDLILDAFVEVEKQKILDDIDLASV